MIVHGSTRSPDSSGDRPCVVWKNCESRKIEPKTPKNIASDVALVALKARDLKKRSGSIGAGARCSQATKATNNAAPAPIEPTIAADVQPSASPRTIPKTTPN